MPFVNVTRSPGVTLEQYQKICEAMGPDAIDGNLARYIGIDVGARCTVDVWASTDHADRFTATRLFPGVRVPRPRPGPGFAYLLVRRDRAPRRRDVIGE
jgi:hypothetical protein